MQGKATECSSRTRYFERYENEADEFGFDPGPFAAVEAFIRLLYQRWFKVEIAGLENIPAKGNAILFGNHSGVLPIDGYLLYDGLINYHPEPRRIRFLVTKFLLKAPLVGKSLRAYGCIPACYDTATKLLREQDLVFLYPEGEKGTGKLFKNRYKLVEFHAGFVRAAIETGSPLIPVVTIGGDEIYPMLANIKPLAKVMNAPYFPITPFWPWLPFPFNFVPLPVRIMTCVWRPFHLKYPPEAAGDIDLMKKIADDIQSDIQCKVNDLLAIRTSPFKKWNMDQVNEYLASTDSYSPGMKVHLQL